MKKKLMLLLLAFGIIMGMGATNTVMADKDTSSDEVATVSQTDSGGRPPM